MRTVEFPPGTRQTTQRGVTAVLRALDRRGVHEWRGTNVTRELTGYVQQAGDQVDLEQVGYALRWLEQRGYGTRELSSSGRYTLGFVLHDDVSTTQVRRADQVNGSSPPSDPDPWDRYHRDRGRRGPDPQPPLPFASSHLYRLDELTAALRTWAEADREAYATWVDRVLENLEK